MRCMNPDQWCHRCPDKKRCDADDEFDEEDDEE